MASISNWKSARRSVPRRHVPEEINGEKVNEITSPRWWDHGDFPSFGYTNVDLTEWANQALTRMSLNGGPTCIRKDYRGLLSGTVAEFEDEIMKLGGRKVNMEPVTHSDKSYASDFIWDDAAVDVYNENYLEGALRVSFVTSDADLAKKLTELIEAKVTPRISGGRVYTVRATSEGLDLVSMGKASYPLERGNYEEDVLKQFDHVIGEFDTLDPCGRLIVVNGRPGTGKTYFMRGLLDAIPKALFITVPPSMISRFANPDFIPTLMDIKRSDKKTSGPIILLVEDADEILVPRNETGMDNISACLNLSDGLMGHLFDLRIVATTNAIKAQMDEAILRPGRLCRRIDVGALSYARASQIYKRLTEKELASKGGSKYVLAELYVMARDNGWSPPKADGKVGFVADSYSPDGY
jgi:hypothetical protein